MRLRGSKRLPGPSARHGERMGDGQVLITAPEDSVGLLSRTAFGRLWLSRDDLDEGPFLSGPLFSE